MKETINKPKVDILIRPKLNFPGLSHVRKSTVEDSEQHIYLLVDTQDSPPKIHAQVKDPTKFREIILAFFQAVQKGINYVSSTDALDAKEQLTSLIRTKDSLSSLAYYQKMYAIMSELDPEGFAVIDPVLTICDGVCYLEVFDKYAKRSLVLTLKEDLFYEGYVLSNGSARIMLTKEFIASLETITGRNPLHLHVGVDVGDESKESEWKGEIVKQFSVELEWIRGALLLQGASALQLHHIDLMRIDFFNALRTLRMRKAKTHPSFKEDRELNSIRFVLEPNKRPVLVFDPWELELECMGDPYSGTKKREIMMFGQRRDLLLFDRFLPYIIDASCTVFDTALHTCVDIKGEGFSCSMVLQGFGGGNWPRRLQMESMLPSFAQRDDASVFATLDKTGKHIFSGEETLSERKVLLADILRGKALFVPGEQALIRRELFSEDIDMNRLEVLGNADTFARAHLASNRVCMKAEYHHDGSLHFEGSTVTEPLREGEETAFVAKPSFVLNTLGQLRKVRCNCVVWKAEEQRGIGGPCSHLRALWLTYCQEQETLREAKDAGLYAGPLLQEERIFTRNKEERTISFDVRAKFLFTEKWRSVENQGSARQTVQVYTTEEQVRSAFDKRIAMLLRRGYTQMGS